MGGRRSPPVRQRVDDGMSQLEALCMEGRQTLAAFNARGLRLKVDVTDLGAKKGASPMLALLNKLTGSVGILASIPKK